MQVKRGSQKILYTGKSKLDMAVHLPQEYYKLRGLYESLSEESSRSPPVRVEDISENY
jgi:hypothetical protein